MPTPTRNLKTRAAWAATAILAVWIAWRWIVYATTPLDTTEINEAIRRGFRESTPYRIYGEAMDGFHVGGIAAVASPPWARRGEVDIWTPIGERRVTFRLRFWPFLAGWRSAVIEVAENPWVQD